MQRTRKTISRIVGAAALCLLLAGLLCGGASAAGPRTLTAGCPSRCGQKVSARWQKEEVVLCLPGCWDATQISLEMNDAEYLTLGKEKIVAYRGIPADLSRIIGDRVEVRDENGKSRGYLTIMQGSRISAVFLNVDPDRLKYVNDHRRTELNDGWIVFEEADGSVSYDGALDQLKSRGNTSFEHEKKPYQFKLHKKASLAGMSKGRTWVLLSNWDDDTLLRNKIVMDMGRQVGLRFAVGCELTDVWINGEYNGLYLLTEKIQIGKNRISITDLEEATEAVNPSPFNPGKFTTETSKEYPLIRSFPDVIDPEDITGGYILTIEKKHRLNEDNPGFRTAENLSIRIKEPTYPSRKQAEYLFRLITEMQAALIADDGICPETGKSYTEYLDVTSFAQRYLVEEWTADFDFLGGSQYIYKDSDTVDPLIYAGPFWDYDLCFGNRKDKGARPRDPYIAYPRTRTNANLYWLLYRHEPFRSEVHRIWREDYRPAVAVLLGETEPGRDSIIRPLDEYLENSRASASMNFVRYKIISDSAFRVAKTNQTTAVNTMRKWIITRTEWMDETYP